MFDSKVFIDYTNGMMINLDANDTLNFIVGLSINVVNTVRDTVRNKNVFGFETISCCDNDVMDLIECYHSGIPGSIYGCILHVNADILLRFVRSIVLNETTRSLYLFNRNKNMKTGKDPIDLTIMSLEIVHNYYMVYGNELYKNDKSNHFNRYNKKLKSLLNKED